MPAGSDVAHPRPKLEREAVTDAIANVLERARAGTGGALFVVGEAGLGKTTCLGMARELAGSDFRVGLGRGNAMEASLPFGLIGQAIDVLGGREVLVPVVEEQWVGDIRAGRFYGVLRWLEGLSSGPALLALDDLHWADPDSLALLSFLCRRIAALPVAIIGTLRPWPPAAAEMASHLLHDAHAAVERLVPLSEDGARSLLATQLDDAVDDQMSASVWQLCGGNPLLVEQVAHAIARGEQLTPVVEGASAVATGELLLTRFAGLPTPGLRCAEAASVLGNRFRPEIAAQIAQVSERESEEALESLWRSGLVSDQTDGWVEFTHPLFCQALYDDLVPPVRARLHARAFTALSRRGDTVAAAEHAVRADLVGDAKAVAVLTQVGDAAARTGAVATATRHLGSAARLAGDEADADLLLSWGLALVADGQPEESLAVCERVADRVDLTLAQRVNGLRTMGRSHVAMGAFEAAAARFEQAADMAEADDPGIAAAALLDDVVASWMTTGPAHTLPLVSRARELGREAPVTVRRRIQIAYSFIAVQAGAPADRTASEAAIKELEAELPTPWGDLCWSWGLYGMTAMFTEQFDDAQRALESALAIAETAGAVEGIAPLSASCAGLFRRIGSLEQALSYARRAAELTELAPMIESLAGSVHAAILLDLGKVAESEALCARVEPVATRRKEAFALLGVWHVRARRLFRQGQIGEACDLYEQVEELTHRLGYRDPYVVPWQRHAVATYLAAGRRDDAARVVAWLEECAAELPSRWPRIAATTSAAMLAAADGDHDRATELFRTILAVHDEVAMPLEKVETLLGYGGLLRRRGHLADARPVLAEALSIAEANSAGWLAEQAAEELSVAGGRRRREARNSTELTMQEQRVAKLAAEGYSNKEIAGRLILSVKTIEFHLQQVYMKLGINSRRQLMTMVARGAQGIFPVTSEGDKS